MPTGNWLFALKQVQALACSSISKPCALTMIIGCPEPSSEFMGPAACRLRSCVHCIAHLRSVPSGLVTCSTSPPLRSRANAARSGVTRNCVSCWELRSALYLENRKHVHLWSGLSFHLRRTDQMQTRALQRVPPSARFFEFSEGPRAALRADSDCTGLQVKCTVQGSYFHSLPGLIFAIRRLSICRLRRLCGILNPSHVPRPILVRCVASL
ncbi:hypothetical protein FIBSPDRAFT_369561 [Athelia psychrophila]|uniref:Uncharacterized protein n=1 Tax=Athelia psychrophila TaxID=1759441 RepID=A0A166PAG1_9AGAM|nr:hypothetical protein FIBSPDRAFT_369561 [Fibularhizoctonia sp. CBS 109695]